MLRDQRLSLPPSLPKAFIPVLLDGPGPCAYLHVCGTLLPEGPRRFPGAAGFPGFPWTRSEGAGEGGTEGWKSPRDSSSLSCRPPKVDGLGCGVAGMALQRPHPGPEVGVHGQQAHEGQGVQHHTEADVQVGEVPFQHL